MREEEKNIHLVVGCKIGDRKAQEQLYRSYYKAMMTLCLRYTKNEQEAMEVLNTGFYKVFKNISSFDESKAGLYTWIRTIIINSCLDFIKQQKREVIRDEISQAEVIHLPPDVFSRMSVSEVLKLVRQLPAATQAVFNLYVMEGYNHREIGELMNISDGTSKWHLSEARKMLKQLISNE